MIQLIEQKYTALDRLPNESDFDYKERLIVAKIDGVLDLDWSEIVTLLGIECTPDHLRKVGRGIYESYMNRKESSASQPASEYEKSIQTQRDELYMLKKQYSDQRREYMKLLDVDARWNHLTDKLLEAAKSLSREKPLIAEKELWSYGDREAVLVLNDFHYGMVTDNIFNKYNTDICKERLKRVVNKTIEACERHRANKIHVILLGDLASGCLHTAVRVASNEDTVEQLMHVSELIAESIHEISNYVNFVDVYSTYGNHMRSIQNKKDSIHSDNMERIVPWWLCQRLKDNERVNIIDSEYYEFICLSVFDFNICCTHGDLDSIRNFGITANTIFTQVYNKKIDYAILADKHHTEEFEQFGIESILCRSLCGSDEYANGKRLYSKPGQTLLIFNQEEGRECTYNIKV